MMFCVIISKIYLFEFEFWAPKNISIYSEHLRYCLNWIPQRSREPSVLGWTHTVYSRCPSRPKSVTDYEYFLPI